MSLATIWLTYDLMHDVCRGSGRLSKKKETQLSACCMMNHSVHQSHVYYPGTLEIVWLIANCRDDHRSKQRKSDTKFGLANCDYAHDHYDDDTVIAILFPQYWPYFALWTLFDWHAISCIVLSGRLWFDCQFYPRSRNQAPSQQSLCPRSRNQAPNQQSLCPRRRKLQTSEHSK